jgi:acetyl-CoA acetyltransferase
VARNPLHDIAIVATYNAPQARVLDGHTSASITLAAAKGVLATAGLTPADIDGISAGDQTRPLIYWLRTGPSWMSFGTAGIPGVIEAALAVAAGLCTTALVAGGTAGVYTERAATAPWTRPSNEFVASQGMFTAAEFALIARRHMHVYGTTAEQIAHVAAVIRNNGHVHPDAIYRGRGPFTVDDILASRMVADPYHLLECAMTSEGGAAVIVTTAERARDLTDKPVYLLGGGSDSYGPSYQHPPAFDLAGAKGARYANGWAGRRTAEQAFRSSGLGPSDVDVLELYDPFAFEIIRQLEAFGFCGEGEGGELVMSGEIEPGGRWPVTTDGGLMSFSHGGASVQLLQRVMRAVEQVRGDCASMQVSGARVALCSGGGPGALFTDVLLVGKDQL